MSTLLEGALHSSQSDEGKRTRGATHHDVELMQAIGQFVNTASGEEWVTLIGLISKSDNPGQEFLRRVIADDAAGADAARVGRRMAERPFQELTRAKAQRLIAGKHQLLLAGTDVVARPQRQHKARLRAQEEGQRIAQHGMRNSNCVAIAPTATISNIIGVSACIEPTFQNLFVKSNLSGEFTVVNEYLVRDLKDRGLWDEVMIADLKYFDGTLSKIDRIPQDLRDLYATAFEVEPSWLVEAASRRQKWIDQAQSLNIYMAGASGKKLDDTYKLAWLRGLKTTYYLRTMAATHVEKSTVASGQLNSVSSGAEGGGMSAAPVEADGPVCTMRPGDPGFEECEACQ